MQIKVTKQVDLINNDAISIVSGQGAQQHHNAYQVFYDFIRKAAPNRILEIGTAKGGFISFLKECTNDLGMDTDIRSYDIKDRPVYNKFRSKGIDIRIKNIFDADYTRCDSEVTDYIKNDGVTIILCDGGNKIKEFNLLSKYLKNNDYILAHDYAESLEIFNSSIKFNIWNWCEITSHDVSHAAKENNLEYYDKEVFERVAWTCRKKYATPR